ncbi:MAG: restriction endonuclease subunit S [Cyclobacteriaceae bacterium]
MRSNYRPIGEYITPIKLKNADLEATELLGINIDKFFMPSVANVVGTDLSKYKVVKKGQFACNRMHVGRDYRIPIALSERDEPFIVSPAYDVFEITRKDELLDEYLMMWFTRPEFDRNAWFHTDADVRGGLPWIMFCSLELPIPSIEKQREIVKEYNTVVNRIKLNEQLNQKLEETAQALYKHWFVDFEFPDENGKPFKSSGGKMVWNEELGKEIPEGWDVDILDNVCKKITDGSHSSPPGVDIGKPMASVKDMYDWGLDLKSARTISENDYEALVRGDCKPLHNDILIAKDGSFLKHIFSIQEEQDVVILSSIAIIRPNDRVLSNFLSLYLKQDLTKRLMTTLANGGAIQRIVLKEFKKVPVLVPDKSTQKDFNKNIQPIFNRCWINFQNGFKLNEIRNIIMSKMTQVEVEEKEVVDGS